MGADGTDSGGTDGITGYCSCSSFWSVVVAVDYHVQEAVVVVLLDPLLSFLSLSINPSSLTSMYLSSPFIMYLNPM